MPPRAGGSLDDKGHRLPEQPEAQPELQVPKSIPWLPSGAAGAATTEEAETNGKSQIAGASSGVARPGPATRPSGEKGLWA